MDRDWQSHHSHPPSVPVAATRDVHLRGDGLSPADPVRGGRVLKRHLGLLRSQLNPAESYNHEESSGDT
jgi:hypothetical protein